MPEETQEKDEFQVWLPISLKSDIEEIRDNWGLDHTKTVIRRLVELGMSTYNKDIRPVMTFANTN